MSGIRAKPARGRANPVRVAARSAAARERERCPCSSFFLLDARGRELGEYRDAVGAVRASRDCHAGALVVCQPNAVLLATHNLKPRAAEVAIVAWRVARGELPESALEAAKKRKKRLEEQDEEKAA